MKLFARALQMAFWVTYDHMGLLILLNLCWAAGVGVPGSVAVAALLAERPAWLAALVSGWMAFGIAHASMAAGIAHVAKTIIETRDASFSDFMRGIRQYAPRAIVLGTFFYAATVCLGVSMAFYPARFGDSAPILAYGAAGAAFWMLLFTQLCGPYLFPALVQKRLGALGTLRLSAALVLARPVYAAGVALHSAIILGLGLAMPPAAVFIAGAAAVVFASTAYEMLARDYARRAGEALPPDGEDDFLNRGFRDFLFPWKM